MQGRAWTFSVGSLLLTLAVLGGCGEEPLPPPRESSPPTDLATRFDPGKTGSLQGQLRWTGEVPKVTPFLSPPRPMAEPPRERKQKWDNPNAPVVDPATHGVKDVAIFLRGIDLARSRPWNLGPVTVEQHAYQYRIQQDGQASRFGFVRRGNAVKMVSTDEPFYSLRARGAACFTLPFPDPHQPLVRPLHQSGVVELSSGSGQFWMRAFLFVDDHPYWTRTDSQGRFTLSEVPEGEYKLVCWLPNWYAGRAERDPDSMLVARLQYRPPVELIRRVVVRRKQIARVETAVSSEAFQR